MAVASSLVQNTIVKNHENTETKFPYRILNDLSKKREAREDVKNDEITNLKQKISELAYDNNRYHLMLSNCSDDHSLEDSTSLFDSSTQSSPGATKLQSNDQPSSEIVPQAFGS